MMDDLIAWLRAQLDDDERVAAAAHVGPWRAERAAESVYADESSVVLMPGPLDGWATYVVPPQVEGRDGIDPADAEHIACWDPTRVLAEVDAKRRIIDEHGSYSGYGTHCDTCRHPTDDVAAGEPWPCPTLRLLALPYADRPGYRNEWRP
jgi:hypothetical protein